METILLISDVSEAELLRTLSWHGADSSALRVMNGTELARHGLICSGTVITQKLLTAQDRTSLLMDIIEANEKITNFFSHEYNDVNRLGAALKSMRSLITGDESSELHRILEGGIFREKNSALCIAYDMYIKACTQVGGIDDVMLIRKAISECEPLEDTEIVILKEFMPSPVELALAERLGGKAAGELSLKELFRAGKRTRAKAGSSVTRAYGASNEVKNVITKILSDKEMSLDNCTVAAADPELYSQLFMELSIRFGIPMTFGCGVPMSCTYTAEFLRLFHRWQTTGFNGAAALEELLLSRAFDRDKLWEVIETAGVFKNDKGQVRRTEGILKDIARTAGELRLNCDAARTRELIAKAGEGDCIKAAGAVFEEFGKGLVYMLENFCTVHHNDLGRLDKGACTAAAGALRAYGEAMGKDRIHELIPELMTRSVCPENRTAGALHITSVEKAAFSLRDHLFIVGLDANTFPGRPSEDPLVLDCDYEGFGAGDFAPTSSNKIAKAISSVKDLAELSAALGGRLMLSYSYLDTAELKKANMSSVMLPLYRSLIDPEGKAGVEELEAAMEECGYFSDELEADRLIGRSFLNGEIIAGPFRGFVKPTEAMGVNCLDDREYSPSEIEEFFYCPKRFMLTRILGIKEPEDERPFQAIGADEFGILIHSAMELLAGSGLTMDKNTFLKKAGELFDGAMVRKSPLAPSLAAQERSEFLRAAEVAYGMDVRPGTKIISAEGSYHAKHPCGVRLYGRPDRIETVKGDCVIGDFKSGRTVKHDPDRPKTFIQTMLYAYLTEHGTNEDKNAPQGLKVKRCEFRYIRIGQTVSLDYDEEVLNKILEQFADCMKQGLFPRADEIYLQYNPAIRPEKYGDNCRYCKLSKICEKAGK